jgi:hypothetical protein
MHDSIEDIIARVVRAKDVCGLTVDGEHVFCDDAKLEGRQDGYGEPLRWSECACRGDARDIIAAIDGAGWVLAPKEPTDEMLSALAVKLDGWVDDLPGCDNPDLYRALLAGRPKP